MTELAAYLMREFGIEYTSADKSANLEHKPLRDVEVLKRSFVQKGPYVFAPLRRDTIDEMFLWTEGKDEADVAANFLDKCRSGLQESWFHGKEYFDEVEGWCRQAMQKYGMRVKFPTYEEWSEHVLRKF